MEIQLTHGNGSWRDRDSNAALWSVGTKKCGGGGRRWSDFEKAADVRERRAHLVNGLFKKGRRVVNCAGEERRKARTPVRQSSRM